MEDRELLELIPLLEKLSKVDSVYSVLKNKDGQVVPGGLGSKQGNNSSLKRSISPSSGSAAVT